MISKSKVLRSWKATPTTHVIRIEKPRDFASRPVQFCGLEFATSEGPIEYPMSMASSPTRDYIEFGARVASGSPWKRAFETLAPGDEVEIDGPYGHFVLDEARDAVFIAGGIGITPLKGMMEFMTDKKLATRGVLLYGNRTESEIAFRAELDALAAANPLLSITHSLSRPEPAWSGRRGRLDAALVREAAAPLREPAFYICGLPEMVEQMEAELARIGVPEKRIVVEHFWGYE